MRAVSVHGQRVFASVHAQGESICACGQESFFPLGSEDMVHVKASRRTRPGAEQNRDRNATRAVRMYV